MAGVVDVFANDPNVPRAPSGGSAGATGPAPTPQMSGMLREPALAGSALVRGLDTAIGTPGDLESLGVRYLANPIISALGGKPEDPQNTLFPRTAQVQALTDRLGLTGRPDLQPSGTGERLTDEISSGIGSVGPMLLGGGGLLGRGLATVPETIGGKLALGAAGAAGSAASGEVAHAMPNAPAAVPLAAGLIGGLLPGAGASLGRDVLNLDAKAAARGLAVAEGRLAGAQGTIADRRAAIQAAYDKTISDAEAQHELTLAHRQDTLNSIAAQHGPEADVEALGQTLKGEAQHWLGGLSDALTNAHSAIDDLVPNDLPVPLKNFADRLEKLKAGNAGPAQNLAEVLTPSAVGKLHKAFFGESPLAEAPKTPAGVGKGRWINSAEAAGPTASDTPLTWSESNALAKSLGAATGNPELLRSIPSEKLASLYQALRSDQRAALEGFGNAGQLGVLKRSTSAWKSNPTGQLSGEDLVRSFDEAKARSDQLYKLAEGHFGKFANSERPGALGSTLLGQGTKDSETLSMLRTESPRSADALASVAIRQPKIWIGLSNGAKKALVPDEALRNKIESTLANTGPDLKLVRNLAGQEKTRADSALQSELESLRAEAGTKQNALSAAKSKRTSSIRSILQTEGTGAGLGAILASGIPIHELLPHILESSAGNLLTSGVGGGALTGAGIAAGTTLARHALTGPAGAHALLGAASGARAGYAPHPAPDGSGAMTTLPDAEYYRLKAAAGG